ncbi:Alpha/Beta hydrolase protein [Hypoxylon trugodes]|uniref:Alpha/Beta hydrolase protein n=1 Tax=Hypoxylon trugodes TaxID=326681 RepID=UPI00219D355D|nr:Alpha/Beta hydrolase protein [Hypoxylon trugodes]KAI1388022.1 Alpha/Beta hydrolase protein [Hypoxylon trugodes]
MYSSSPLVTMNTHFITFIFILSLFSSLVSRTSASPAAARNARDSLPILELPYALYRAASYDNANDIYTFKNVRYAAPPVGDLRWAKPAPPLNESGIQDGSKGHSCVQAAPNGLNLLGTGNQSPVGGAINQFLGGIPIPIFSGGSEDCLFLDMYVPGKAIKNPSQKLPVVVFVYGGGYVFGSKDSLQPELPFYDGTGLVTQSGNNMIFVAMNYRVGAYGFLAGTTMEKEGLPNAGLWDQRAAFQWVKDYIHLVGGDSTRVTAMGQSAGGGSILHHLIGEGGRLDPLFSKAILLSPAFEYIWDRAGAVQKTFETFASLAGCPGQGVSCLRRADAATLAKANTALMKQQYSGTFAVGPTPDGSYIRQLPVLELSTGNFWNIDSLILSHTTAEANVFVNGLVQTDKEFTAFVDAIFPNYTQAAGITDKINAFYAVSSQSQYKSQTDRVQALLRDSSFTCNVRHLTESVGDSKVWNMQYGVSPGWHGMDLFPTFFNSKLTGNSWLENLAALMTPGIGSLVSGISVALQSYFTSYILTGDPNTNRKIFNLPPTIRWNHPDSQAEQISEVVNLGDWGFSTVQDTQDEKTACDFWRNVAAAVTSLGGYSPPGAVVQQGLVMHDIQDPSVNYRGGNR